MEATLFFWAYTIFIILILLNMMLAIILDTYVEIKDEAHTQETVWAQVALAPKWAAARLVKGMLEEFYRNFTGM
jgi:hypothetical protein